MDSDPLVPYPDTYWFSQPNSCPTLPWSKKTDQCRQDEPDGLCPFGLQQGGTFVFDALGYQADDVVGITAMKNPATNKP
ncbi:TPA: hypothetical protein N0F65_003423 [Lagenidium giganteum]|uniref:Uncharacterized protein n=1 Tax=Lagenidium giganteum TaxID=4803 RepID=A0AAV2YN08_9STRA|nr:TPA: hypothetical protein N0F65_003423 [Lagenidium giganteum]